LARQAGRLLWLSLLCNLLLAGFRDFGRSDRLRRRNGPAATYAGAEDQPVGRLAPSAAPVPAAQPVAPAEVAKPAKKVAKQKKPQKSPACRAIWYPTIYPNPLAFNHDVGFNYEQNFRRCPNTPRRQMAHARRAALARQQPQTRRQNASATGAQNARANAPRSSSRSPLAPQTSTAASATKKLVADGKEWFEEFLVDFLKKQDAEPTANVVARHASRLRQSAKKPANPRDAIQAGVAKLVKGSLSKEKVANTKSSAQTRRIRAPRSQSITWSSDWTKK